MAKVDYLATLDTAWAQHLTPRASDAPTVISTFAGCGGSSLGYSMAGFRELLAVEWNDNAVETFRRNFAHVPVYQGDIAALSVEQCMSLAELSEKGELDVLDGSPPCQGFSMSGKRELNDPRNDLFLEFVRLARGLQPKVLIMENVGGLVRGKMKLVFAKIMRELKASGYLASAQLMNAMYFGAPQSRERLIFIGIRQDLGIEPSHPKAQMLPYTLADALATPIDHKQPGPRPSPRVIQFWQETPRGCSHHKRFSLNRGHWHKTPRTLQCSQGGMKGHMHPDEPRHFSLGELQRIASFPDAFEFVGSWGQGKKCIGNSVPPLFMRAIAQHVREQVLA